MIFNGNNDRVNSPLCNVVETPTSLIMYGLPYDKKTLAQLSLVPVEISATKWGDNAPKSVGLKYTMQCGAMGDKVWSEFGRIIDVDGTPNNLASVQDSGNSNITYTFHGDRVTIYNNENGSYSHNATPITISQCVVLGQDANYIYCIYCTTTYSYIWINSYNKNTGVWGTASELGMSYYTKVRILFKSNEKAYVATSSYVNASSYGSTTYYGVYMFNSGQITKKGMNPSSLDTVINTGYGTTCVSSFDKSKNTYYSTSYSTYATLNAFKIEDDTPVAQSSVNTKWFDDTEEPKIKMKEYFLTRFDGQVDSDNWTDKRNSELNFDTSFQNRQFHVLGENEEFLVVSTFPSGKSGLESEVNMFIAVFKRNNPTTDPLDLTLVDYIRSQDMKDVVAPTSPYMDCYYLGGYKFAIMNSDNLIFINMDKGSGKLSRTIVPFPSLQLIGFDGENRLYVFTTLNNNMDIYNDRVPTSLELSYAAGDNGYVTYPDQPVTKKAVVTTKNLYGAKVKGSYQLTLLGDGGIFTGSSSTTVRGDTGTAGQSEVPIKISKPGMLKVVGKVLYNNELAVIEGED